MNPVGTPIEEEGETAYDQQKKGTKTMVGKWNWKSGKMLHAGKAHAHSGMRTESLAFLEEQNRNKMEFE
jgi:hypothetical protein